MNSRLKHSGVIDVKTGFAPERIEDTRTLPVPQC